MAKKRPKAYRQQALFPDANIKQARWYLCQDIAKYLYHSEIEDCSLQEFHAKIKQQHDYQIPIIQLDKSYEHNSTKK